MDNLDAESIEQLQDHDQPCIMGNKDEIVSIPDTEPDGTTDCVHQGHPTNTNITSKTRILPILNKLPMDYFNQPPPVKSSKDPINPVIPTTVINTSEAKI